MPGLALRDLLDVTRLRSNSAHLCQKSENMRHLELVFFFLNSEHELLDEQFALLPVAFLLRFSQAEKKNHFFAAWE